jgi:hypothetical protein
MPVGARQAAVYGNGAPSGLCTGRHGPQPGAMCQACEPRTQRRVLPAAEHKTRTLLAGRSSGTECRYTAAGHPRGACSACFCREKRVVNFPRRASDTAAFRRFST